MSTQPEFALAHGPETPDWEGRLAAHRSLVATQAKRDELAAKPEPDLFELVPPTAEPDDYPGHDRLLLAVAAFFDRSPAEADAWLQRYETPHPFLEGYL